MRLHKEKDGVVLRQDQYVDSMRQQSGMTARNPLRIILDMDECVDKKEIGTPELHEVRKAQAAVGEANWLSPRTRPEIAYTVSRMLA
jgi:hypothetical protein